LISIITATYNAAQHLPDAIRSVRGQTDARVQWIIIDGGSSDATVKMLRSNEDVIDYWLSEPDAGIYDAWNKGLAKVTGDWVCFLGADDYLWSPDTLQNIASSLENVDKDVLVAYAKIMLLNSHGDVIHPIGDPWTTIRDRFTQTMCLNHQGVLHRRQLFESCGNFDQSFRIAGDYELLLRYLPAGGAVFIPGIIFAGMRQGGVSSSPQNSLALLAEIRRAQKMHGYRRPGLVWLRAIARSYMRLLIWNLVGEKRARVMLDLGRRVMGLPPFWTKS
jgi:glycosyltransferase involved in cell wall biosynthesis